jgi:hypothetical protein
MKKFLAIAAEKGTIATSAKVALVVGSILGLINHGDRIFLSWDMRAVDWIKLALTYCVPYCVATYGAVKYALRHTRSNDSNAGD